MAILLQNAAWIDETLRTIALEIISKKIPGKNKALVGIHKRGAILAVRLHQIIKEMTGDITPVGFLDTTLYRDDLDRGNGLKLMQPTEIPFDINDTAIYLCDDVIATGRSIRAAMGALFSFGRPACVRLFEMIDRGGRELPIQPDLTGTTINVAKGSFVRLRLTETDGHDAVYVVGQGDEEPA